jgi:hypothetical protein
MAARAACQEHFSGPFALDFELSPFNSYLLAVLFVRLLALFCKVTGCLFL